MEWFYKLKTGEKVIVSIIALVVIIWLWKLGGSFVSKTINSAENIGETAALQAGGMRKSYSDSQYTGWANQLYYAMYGAGTDNATVTSVFQKQKNDLDIIALEEKFGLRPDWKGSQYNLQQWMRGDLSAKEMMQLNQMLASKGITKTF